MPLIRQETTDRRNPASIGLLRYAKRITSQYGEDGILERIFQLIGPRNRWAVEFGAWDGKHLSNTWDLLTRQGWRGVLIEADSEKSRELSQNFREYPNVIAINALVGLEGQDSCLDAILSAKDVPADFDLLSVDVDGLDWHIWRSLERFQPRVIVIEFNPTVSNDVVFVQDAESSINQGCSLRALIQLGKEKGYELSCVTEVNAIFVRAQEFSQLGIADNSIDSMRLDPGLRIWSGYDGTIFTAGMDYLPWTNIKVEPEDLQVLPRSLRRYHEARRD
jgi:hypothetical protein